jgi:5-methylcytosine-specific restriction enzyme A
VNTYLLAWNPHRYPWDSLEDAVLTVSRDGSLAERWSAGNTRSIRPSDRLFLIRIGEEPRGIVGSGWATSSPFRGTHWDPVKVAAGVTANYIYLDFDWLFDEPQLPMEQLRQADKLRDFHWSVQASGVSIPDDVATELERAWGAAVGTPGHGFPGEAASTERFSEGAAMQVYVNRYERDPAARQACIDHYGRACAVCGMTFAHHYGPVAASLVQVHHLEPLGENPGDREVDPVKDLRPICPNCHAVVHLKKPPLSIDQAAALLTGVKAVG